MEKTDKRTDIELSDVFISWTSEDKTLKNAIKGWLRKSGLKCTDSEEACQGDFEQWSEEAARSSSVFVLILTDNSLYESKYVPLETRSALKMDDAANRIVVVCPKALVTPNYNNLYDKEKFGENGQSILRGKNISIIDYDGEQPTEQKLDEIYDKVTSLITNRFFAAYDRATAADYIELIPLYKKAQKKTKDMPLLYNDLYVPRTITEIGANGEELATLDSPEGLIESGDVLFLVGAGGSGKSQYLKQIRHTVDENTLMVALPCSKIANSAKPLFDDMYDYFRSKIGDRDFYSQDNFRRLLATKKLLLVFDGMDEIPTERITRKFLDKVREFYEPNSKDTTLLFTGRNDVDAGYITLGGKKARKFRLNKLADEDIKRLGDNLFLVLGNRDKGEEFYVHVQELNDEIKSNPLLLSQLAIIYNDSGKIPETIVGIFDAVSEIMFKRDSEVAVNEIPAEYRNIIERDLGELLKEFAAKRYLRISQGKAIKAVGIFQELLKRKYADRIDCGHGARFLLEYIKGRAIYIESEYDDDGGEFYHKMFSEYFTAVYYYEKAFNLCDEIEDGNVIAELFSHYSDSYWAKVLQLFLVKADSLIDRQTTAELYSEILSRNGINEYTLLLDSCRDLIRHKQAAQTELVSDILQKSVSGEYPPYGPLFWYVPEYELYEVALLAAQSMSGNAKALALVRDVCYIYGQKNNIKDITDKVSGRQLFDAASAELSGVRRALCEIFYLGDTEYDGGKDIYPRCFNVAETLSFRDNSCGIIGRMTVPFDDELGLYSHKSYNLMNGDVIGLVSCPYDVAEVESTLGAISCRKLSGLIFTPTNNRSFKYMNFTRCFVRVLYVPENIVTLDNGCRRFMPLIFDLITQYNGIFHLFDDGIWYLFGDIILPKEYNIKKCKLLNCNTVKCIVIPDGVEEIGGWAFQDCNNLKEIRIPDSVKKIGESAFYGCSNLREMWVPDGVEEIGKRTFDRCSNLKEIRIPDSVKKIGESAFYDCSSLKEMWIPDGVEKIEKRTFEYCSKLKEIRIPDSVKKIGESAFYGCGSLKEIRIPDGIKEIAESTFSECSNLKKIHLPDGIDSIGMCAFMCCRHLNEIYIPDSVNSINDGAFSECSRLQYLRISNKVEKIGEGAFYGCSNLVEIEIPDSVKNIGINAFKKCIRLKRITISEIFKDKIQTIGFSSDASFVWKECHGVEEAVIIEDEIDEIKEGGYRGSLAVEFILPASLIKIGSRSFEDCHRMKELIVPNKVTEIGEGAFYGCSSLKEMRVPDGVEEIAENTFFGCSSLKEIRLPDSINKIGEGAFCGCSILKEIRLPDKVDKIEKRVFYDCSNLKEILMPDKVDKIGDGAFSGCHSLKAIHLPNGIESIGICSFMECSRLQKIDIPESVKKIKGAAFYGCSNLKEVRIPCDIKKIEIHVFYKCSSLGYTYMSDNVTEIGDGAFSKCSSLKEIRLSDELDKIEKRAFIKCSSLKEICIPKKVTKIGYSAFEGCSSLPEITIPQSVIDIGDDAFKGCTGLKSVTISINFKNDIRRIFGDIDPSIIHFV